MVHVRITDFNIGEEILVTSFDENVVLRIRTGKLVVMNIYQHYKVLLVTYKNMIMIFLYEPNAVVRCLHFTFRVRVQYH